MVIRKEYLVEYYRTEVHKFSIKICAVDEEEAKKLVLEGEGDFIEDDFIDGETEEETMEVSKW